MKRIKYVPYVLLGVFIIFLTIFYHREDDIYAVIGSSLYYMLIYTPIYLYIVSCEVKETFCEMIILRRASKIKNTYHYIKRIIKVSVLYSITFSITVLVSLCVLKQMDHIFPFIGIVFVANMVGWSFIGSVYYLVFSLKNQVMALIITWTYCVFMALSNGVLFRLGKYIYNVFNVMMMSDGTHYEEKLLKMLLTVILTYLIFGMILLLHKKHDVLRKEIV